jgi:hypothetical protein
MSHEGLIKLLEKDGWEENLSQFYNLVCYLNSGLV